jgi:hypothetical protein
MHQERKRKISKHPAPFLVTRDDSACMVVHERVPTHPLLSHTHSPHRLFFFLG